MRYRELADAIRRGIKFMPYQTFYVDFDGKGGACAFATAMVGCGENTGQSFLEWAKHHKIQDYIVSQVVSFNDVSRMPREQIADWLDSLEEPGESDSDWAKRKVAEVTRVKEAA